MKLSVCRCLFAFNLICKLTVGLILVAEEKKMVVLRCCPPVDQEVTWSKQADGVATDLLIVHGDGEIKLIKDPDKRYRSQADRSLVVLSAAVSDSGWYLCNGQPAVDLTVVQSGVVVHRVAEGNSTTLRCPRLVGGSGGPTWSREGGARTRRFPPSENLTLTDLRPADSGLYYCAGEPAAYLQVLSAETSSTPGDTPGPTTQPGEQVNPTDNHGNQLHPADKPLLHVWLPAAGGALLLLLLLLVVVCCIQKKRSKTEADERCHVYAEVSGWSVVGAETQQDPTTSTLCPPTHSESPYMLLGASLGSNDGPTGPRGLHDNTQF